jgi:hypothetical protein
VNGHNEYQRYHYNHETAAISAVSLSFIIFNFQIQLKVRKNYRYVVDDDDNDDDDDDRCYHDVMRFLTSNYLLSILVSNAFSSFRVCSLQHLVVTIAEDSVSC